MDEPDGPKRDAPPGRPWVKPVVLVAVAAVAGVLYWRFGEYLSFQRAAAAEE